jgi:transaldolase
VYDDVKNNAPGIYDRLMDGSMPCDGAWPTEQIVLFRQWMDEGYSLQPWQPDVRMCQRHNLKRSEHMTTKAAGIGTIHELARKGQSLWLDNLQRRLITSGELARLRDAGITGITSNPTIFEKAISSSSDYQADLRRLAKAGSSPEQIMWELMIEDIQAATDIFRPVYEGSGGADGFVSIEVGPAIARDTSRTIEMAEEIHRRCARPNVMVKIPATQAGLAAIRYMIGEGKHTNVTLTFSVARYAEVVEAYLSALEDLQKRGGDLSRVASVASFFVSRIDTKVDKILDARIEATSDARVKRENSRAVRQDWHCQLEDGVPALPGAVLRPALGGTPASWRQGSAMPVGQYFDQKPAISRHNVHRGIDRAGHRQHCAGGDPRGTSGPREGAPYLARRLERGEAPASAPAGLRELEAEGVQGFVNSYESLLEVIKDACRNSPPTTTRAKCRRMESAGR